MKAKTLFLSLGLMVQAASLSMAALARSSLAVTGSLGAFEDTGSAHPRLAGITTICGVGASWGPMGLLIRSLEDHRSAST